MGEGETDRQHVVVEDKKLETILDAVDSRTAHLQLLHDHISDGFMALARERYANPSSSERLGRLVHDNREDMKSDVLVEVDSEAPGGVVTISRLAENAASTDDANKTSTASTLRRRGAAKEASTKSTELGETEKKCVHLDVRNRIMPIPSREVREAIKCFRMAVDQAIEVINATGRVDALIRNVE